MLYTGFISVNTLLWDIARRGGKYQALFSLPQQHQMDLRQTYEEHINQAAYRNASSAVRWIPYNTFKKHLPEDDPSFIQNTKAYLTQCALHTIRPQHAVATTFASIPIIAVAAKLFPTLAPYWHGMRCITTALHAAIAFSKTTTLQQYATPIHTRVYQWLHHILTHNPEALDVFVRSYCRHNEHNPHIRRWMRYAYVEHETIPLRFPHHTTIVQTELIEATTRAMCGRPTPAYKLTQCFSRPYPTHRKHYHPTLDEFIALG